MATAGRVTGDLTIDRFALAVARHMPDIGFEDKFSFQE